MKVCAYPSKKNKDEYLILSASPRQKEPPSTVRNRFEVRPYKEFDTCTNPIGLDPQAPQTIADDGYYIATTKLGFAERVSVSRQRDI